ncbi:phospholipid-transporting ATPase ABCA3-like [Amblyomma americanum]
MQPVPSQGTLHVLRQLNLLLWKNLLVTQFHHHYVITMLELLLPATLSYAYSVLELDFSRALPIKEEGKRQRTLREAFLVYWSTAPDPYFPVDVIRKIEASVLRAANASTRNRNVNMLHKQGLSGYVLTSLPFVLVLSMPLPGFAYRVSMEVNSGAKGLMEAYGVSSWVYWMGNLVVELAKLFFITVPTALVWTYTAVFQSTSIDVQLLLITLFFASSLALCLLIASFATRPGVAALSVVVMTLTSTLLPVVAVVGYSVEYIDMTRLLQLLSCLIPDVALTYAFTMMFINEEVGGELITSNDLKRFVLLDVTLYKMVHAMMATFGICLLLAMYVDRVWPGGDSVPERALFFTDPSFWGVSHSLFGEPKTKMPMDAERHVMEPVVTAKQPFLVVHKLTKEIKTVLKTVTVLRSVSLKTYSEHVTVLLGSNGSGKSLILKIVAGLTRPNGGTVYVGSGWDIRHDLGSVRQLLGYCPQTSALLDELSVEENLRFFAGLRTLAWRKARSDAQISLYDSQLYNRRREIVRDLNYNDRRRLQLAIALVGSPAYLLLDEPTLGVDLETKHSMWEMILKARQQSGILLVTNSIDEAELLGDRIAIIAQGDVACCGSSLYLRKRHGSGYRFSILMDENSDVTELTAFIQKVHPSAELYMERRRSVVYTVGFPGTKSLIDLLRKLEENQERLGIKRIGVNTASLEDVMLRVRTGESELAVDEQEASATSHVEVHSRSAADSQHLFLCQVDALVRKKLASWRRTWGIQAAMLAVQLCIVGCATAYLSTEYPFAQMGRQRRIGSALDRERAISAPKGRALFLSLDFDRLSQELHAVVLKVRLVVGALVPVAMSLSAALRLLLPLQERTSAAKQLQLMTGLSAARYWSITFITDMLYHLFTTLVLLVPFFLPTRSDNICQNFAYMGPFFSLFFMFGWSFVPLTYLASFMTDQMIAGYVMLVLSTFFFGAVANSYMDMVGPSTVSNFRPSGWTSEVAEMLMVLMRLLPQYAVGHGAGELQGSFSEHAACCRLHSTLLWYLCAVPLDNYPKDQQPFASRIRHCCNEARSKVTSAGVADCRQNECEPLVSPRSPWNVLSSGWDLLMMFLTGLLYMASVVSWEQRLGLKLPPMPLIKRSTAKLAGVDQQRHPSVTEEADLVKKLLEGEGPSDSPRQVRGLLASELRLNTGGRVMGPLSFHVDQGEVFGIIGMAQSGRSSLLAALAGEKLLTGGTLLFNGASSASNRLEYQRQIGYCPRENPVITRLNSHEMLQLIARLRGLPNDDIEQEVSSIESKVGLRDVLHESIDKLKPCDKRKLSVGLALVGNPKLVILNECTREVDPASRRRLFRCIEKIHTVNQSSMVFTSHCLRECDSFCDRVGVLSSGEFQVIGETSLMKEGCQQRFTATMRLTPDQVKEGDFFKTVNRVMKDKFPTSLISDIRMDMLQYTVKDVDIPWSDVFVRMEDIKEQLDLEDYVVCEASLADVFLGFSHERKVVDFSGAEVRVYSMAEPCDIITEVPGTPTMLGERGGVTQ